MKTNANLIKESAKKAEESSSKSPESEDSSLEGLSMTEEPVYDGEETVTYIPLRIKVDEDENLLV
jgi:hypothetical protein